MKPPLFQTPNGRVCELGAHDVPALQRFFDDNPEYFITVNGRLPAADEAQLEFDDVPPPHLTWSRRWLAGVFDSRGGMCAMLSVLSDLCAPHVWHVGLFIIASRLHGGPTALELHAAMTAWMRTQGARWVRLGVVVGNAKAERFWHKCRYVEIRRCENVDTGGRINALRVMVKPLFDAGPDWVEDYLTRVPRDRPGSMLP